MNINEIKSVVVATHTFAYGTSQGFYDYCRSKGWEVMFIGHPLFGNAFTWTWGVIDILIKVLAKHKVYDLYMGSNNLNAFVGIILKKMGRVRRVVYFSPDWVVSRFGNEMLNKLYRELDHYCVVNSDITWNSSQVMKVDPMMREREKVGYPIELRKKQIQVSDGTEVIELPKFLEIERWKIGFIGHLRAGMGVELLIAVMPIVVKKFPKAKLLIMGSGPLEEQFRKDAKGVPIEFTGFMGDINEVYRQLSKCAIAVAPYEPGSISEYTDPGKVKSYLTAGLPIVITDVPKVAKEISFKKVGIIAEYKASEFAKAIINILKSTKELKAYRKNALKLRDEYSWEKIFDRAISLS